MQSEEQVDKKIPRGRVPRQDNKNLQGLKFNELGSWFYGVRRGGGVGVGLKTEENMVAFGGSGADRAPPRRAPKRERGKNNKYFFNIMRGKPKGFGYR